MKRVAVLFVLVVMVTAAALPAAAQLRLGPRPKATAAEQTQAPDASSQTQNASGGTLDDQVISYRFHLAPVDRGADLVVLNPSGEPGVLTLFAAESTRRGKLQMTLAPGQSYALSSAEGGWVVTDVALVKASRRLRLSLRYAAETEPAVIEPSPRAAMFEVFSSDRRSEIEPQAFGHIEFFGPGRHTVRKLTADDAAQFSATIHALAEGGSGRGVYVAYKGK